MELHFPRAMCEPRLFTCDPDGRNRHNHLLKPCGSGGEPPGEDGGEEAEHNNGHHDSNPEVDRGRCGRNGPHDDVTTAEPRNGVDGDAVAVEEVMD